MAPISKRDLVNLSPFRAAVRTERDSDARVLTCDVLPEPRDLRPAALARRRSDARRTSWRRPWLSSRCRDPQRDPQRGPQHLPRQSGDDQRDTFPCSMGSTAETRLAALHPRGGAMAAGRVAGTVAGPVARATSSGALACGRCTVG